MTGATGRTSYADLMGDAAHHVALASVALSREPLSDPGNARTTVESYWQLLKALHQHAWQLAGGSQRIEGISASAGPDLPDAAAVRFIDALARTARHPAAWDACPASGVGIAWSSAAASIRTATDLLSTHRDPRGVRLTPEATMLDDPEVRAQGFSGLADIATTVLAAERDLGLRCGQAAVPWREVGRRLPDLEPARIAACDLVRDSRSNAGGRNFLGALEVARPEIRSDDPVIELGDRILRLRQTAWQLTLEPHVGSASLTDFAAAAVIAHTHASAYLSRRTASEFTDFPTHSMARRTVGGRAAWTLVHLQTRQLRTASPGLGVIRTDLLAVRDLCRVVLPLGGPVGLSANANDERRVRALVNGGIRSFADIAQWNAAVTDRIGLAGEFYVPARTLSGEQVTDQSALVEAKLRGRLAPAPGEQVQRLVESYAAAFAVAPEHSRKPIAAVVRTHERVPLVNA